MSPLKIENCESLSIVIDQDFKLESQFDTVKFLEETDARENIKSKNGNNLTFSNLPQNSDNLIAADQNTVSYDSTHADEIADANLETSIGNYDKFKCEDCNKKFLFSIALRLHRKNKCPNSKNKTNRDDFIFWTKIYIKRKS